MPNLDLRRIVLILIALALVGSVLYSMWVDTLQPIYATGDMVATLRTLGSLITILIGTAIIVFGGFQFVRDVFSAFATELQPLEMPGARWHNFKALLKSFARGTLLILFGFALLAIGGWLLNM